MSARAWSHILPLARAYSLPVYDAAYLELALRLKLPLATIDPNLTRTAANVGVPIFTP
ncbi:MAG: type II toxin-antitoxin system VapC family toxin [Planctomycetes bacterium]|nr:type II toxin-antitoxin system VapC family toxin [Planctomycetota bacterium]